MSFFSWHFWRRGQGENSVTIRGSIHHHPFYSSSLILIIQIQSWRGVVEKACKNSSLINLTLVRRRDTEHHRRAWSGGLKVQMCARGLNGFKVSFPSLTFTPTDARIFYNLSTYVPATCKRPIVGDALSVLLPECWLQLRLQRRSLTRYMRSWIGWPCLHQWAHLC